MPRKDTYILDRPTGRIMRARDALVVVAVAVLVLLVVKGQSIRGSGEKMEPGLERSVVLAVGHPAGWIADRFGLHDDVKRLTASLSPDDTLSGPGGFDDAPTSGAQAAAARGAVAPVTADAFDPAALGEKPVRARQARARCSSPATRCHSRWTCSSRGGWPPTACARCARSSSAPASPRAAWSDWGALSTHAGQEGQARRHRLLPRRQRGLPVRGRRRQVDRLLRPRLGGAVRDARAQDDADLPPGLAPRACTGSLLPMPRSAARQKIARTVNAAIIAAAQPFRAQVRVLDMSALFTPGGKYRASMPVKGRNTIVREPDGIHLNEAGAGVAADVVIARLRADFASL